MRSAIKYHGGKSYIAKDIIELMAPHTHYVEPYFGSGAVLFAKDPNGVSEVINDFDENVMTFWKVLRELDTFAQFQRKIEATPFSEQTWQEAMGLLWENNNLDEVSRAWAFFVACRQSLAGRMDSFAPLSKTRTRRQMNEQCSAWLSSIEALPQVHARLKRVAILCRPALSVIAGEDTKQTLHYLDPPYLKETRVSPEVYANEMTEGDHRELLALVVSLRGKVILSGYPSKLYDDALPGWRKVTIDVKKSASGSKEKPVAEETLWLSY